MRLGPTKSVEICIQAMTLVIRCRKTVADIIRTIDLVIARRLSIAERLYEVMEHIAKARELSAEDQEAELQRAENGIRQILVAELQGEDIQPAFQLRQSFCSHDRSMETFTKGIESALHADKSTEPLAVAMHVSNRRWCLSQILFWRRT